jgi:hypothetical protein
MIQTGETHSTWRKTCHSSTVNNTNQTQIGLRLSACLHGERMVTKHLKNGKASVNSDLLGIKKVKLCAVANTMIWIYTLERKCRSIL